MNLLHYRNLCLLLMTALVKSFDPAFWPGVWTNSAGVTYLVSYDLGEEPEPSEAYCDGKAVSLKLGQQKNHSTFGFSIAKVILDSSKCKPGAKFTIKMKDVNYGFKLGKFENLHYSVHLNDALRLPGCVNSMQYMDMLFPCFEEKFFYDCNEALVCKGKVILNRPTLNLLDTNNSKLIRFQNNDCTHILVSREQITCNKEKNPILRLSDAPSSDIHCEISSAKVTESKSELQIQVSQQPGNMVCIEYASINNDVNQACAMADSTGKSIFHTPIKVWNMKTRCDGGYTSYKQEVEDLNCPLMKMFPYLSKSICVSVWKPTVFWISMLWLMTGLPFCWFFIKVYIWYKLKGHMKQIRSPEEDTCKFCCNGILSVIDLQDHLGCVECVCPYCKMNRNGMADLRKHSAKCVEKALMKTKIEKIMVNETTRYLQIHDSGKAYLSNKLRIVWFLTFLVIFFAMFTPSVANAHDNVRLIMSRHQMEPYLYNTTAFCTASRMASFKVNNDHVPINEASDSDANDTPKFVSINTVIERMSQVLVENIEQSKNVIMTSMMGMERNMENRLNNVEELIVSLKNDIMSSEDGREKTKIYNLNTFVPYNLVSAELEEIMLHDSVAPKIIHALETMNSAIQMNDNSNRGVQTDEDRNYFPVRNDQLPRGGMSVGQDAQLSFGPGNHHQAGGSGGHNQLASDGSKNYLGSQSELDDQQSQQSFSKPTAEENERTIRFLNTLGSVNHREKERTRWRHPKTHHQLRPLQRFKRQADPMMALEVDMIKVAMLKKEQSVHKTIQEKMQSTQIGKSYLDYMNKDGWGKNKGTKFNSTTFNNKHTPLEVNRNKKMSETHKEWFKYSDDDTVCQISCLHEPGVCECTTQMAAAKMNYELPWTSIAIDDIKFVANPNKFVRAMTTISSESESEVMLDSNVDVVLDLSEGSFLTIEFPHEKIKENPTMTVIIPAISQIYSTNFLYFTCERRFSTEVKGLCTGDCGDYCNGKVCLGSRIWKWNNCRKVTCNPSWCWSTGDGCCCCGANVECGFDSPVGALWETRYLRTEMLVCIISNDRLENCQLASGTGDIEVGGVELSISRILDPADKVSRYIFTKHQPLSLVSDTHKFSRTFSDPENIYLDPPVCINEQSCNHGFIGDVQSSNLSCLLQMGQTCKPTKRELELTGCLSELFVSHSDTNMQMTCHSFHHHSCQLENAIETLKFSDHFKNSEELKSRFNIKKFRTNLNEKSLLMYVNSKSSAGTVIMEAKFKGIIGIKKDVELMISNFRLTDCHGCFSCKVGFTCKLYAEQTSSETALVKLLTESPQVTFPEIPIMLKEGINNIIIKAVAYEEVDQIEVCMMSGSKCLIKTTAALKLSLPNGQFKPHFKDLTAEGEDGIRTKECSGLQWFSCAFESFKDFFVSIGTFIKNFWWVFILFVLAVLSVIFLPYVIKLVSAIIRNCKKVRSNKKPRYAGTKTNDLFKKISLMMNQKNDAGKEDDEYELKLLSEDGYEAV